MARTKNRRTAIKQVLVLLALLLLGLALSLALPDASARAGGRGDLCLPRAEMTRLLAARFEERPAALGPTEPGGLVELFKAPGGRTWTLIITLPDGESCLLASGADWSEGQDRILKAGP